MHRVACVFLVPLLFAGGMAATTTPSTEGQFVRRESSVATAVTTPLGYYKHAHTVAPLVARSAKALSASATEMATARGWHSTGGWQMLPSQLTPWNSDNRIPMNQESANSISRIGRVELDDEYEEGRGKNKYYKKYKKYMLPLLLAYKLKFFTLVPILIGGLVLLTGATGLAGFFFALFAATMGLKGGGEH